MSQAQTVLRIDGPRNSVHNLKAFKKEIPIPAKHEVLVNVHSVSLNYRDIGVATSGYPFPVKDNVVPCSDAAVVRDVVVGSTQLLQEVVRFVARKGLRLLVEKEFGFSQSLRLSDLEESGYVSHSLGWREWSQQEYARRTNLLAFCFLSTQSIVIDVPPSVWCDEIDLVLRCPWEEWAAPNEDAWRSLRQNNLHRPRRFQDTLEILLSPDRQADHFLPNTPLRQTMY